MKRLLEEQVERAEQAEADRDALRAENARLRDAVTRSGAYIHSRSCILHVKADADCDCGLRAFAGGDPTTRED